MILVDTGIWVDHLGTGNPMLAYLLEGGVVLIHPWVIGELALGNLGSGSQVLRLLQGLPKAVVASDEEMLTLIGNEGLTGAGICYMDAQLVAATRLTPGARLWTAERRLAGVAARLGVGFEPEWERPSTGARR